MNFFLVLFIASNIVGIYGHGRLMDPPSRNAMWREGYDNPPDYNDNQLYCGGLTVQEANGGKCGVCGDNYADPTPRAHEDGGMYGNGIITREYKVGDWTYVGANNWGTCDNGTEGMGCGPQETFKNCADVSISASVEGTVVKPGSKAVYYSGDEYSNVVKKDGAFSDGKKKLLVVR
ncbi:hypothetical protein Avbf_17296 [Armadillidium vulgare]|nr:hypothetical protein Avbf_17296 [Armadillidium vulgare]